MALDLRPLTLAELLDRSFSLYRHHFWLFVGIMAVPSVFGLAGGVLLQVLNAGMTGFASSTKPPTPEQLLTMFVPFVIGLVLFSLLYGLTYMFALGATTVAVSDLYLGRDTTLGTAYASTRRHIVRLLLLMLWTMLRIGGVLVGGMTIVVVGGTLLGFVSPILTVLVMLAGFPAVMFLFVFMMLRYAVTVPAVLLEQLTAGRSIQRSIVLTRGNLLRVFVLFICAGVIAYATALLCQGPFMIGAFVAGEETTTAFWFRIAGLVFGTIGGTFSAPFGVVGLALMYYDLRIRKEAFDLQHMLNTLDPPPAAAPAAAQP
ncbi:MAG: hypothetical protein DMF86_17210 [Acidobacteria bacterium]|nr:MAG: hypothetical protein DMF86_17210 [Acidobacteriota bacterium]